MLWTKYFLEAQGYGIDENIMYQDNLSVMLLEKNGKKSSTKNTKHINVRYYFIKDRILSGELSVQHCPTKQMLADHFTKPLQGELFRKFRAELMNIPEDIDMSQMGWDGTGHPKGVTWKLHNETDPACPQECVGDYDGPSVDVVVTAHEKCNKRRRDAKCPGPSILLDKKDRSEGSLRNSSTYSRPVASKASYAQILKGKPTGGLRKPTYNQSVLERGTVLKQ